MLGFAGLGVAAFSLFCVILSLALDYWVFYDGDGTKINYGLWKGCVTLTIGGVETEVCDDEAEDPSDSLKAVRAMVILGLILHVGAIACMAIKLFVKKDQKIVGFAAAGLLAVAGLFLMIGFAVYHADEFDDYKDTFADIELHAGFAFCIISWLASWVAAALFGVATMKDESGVASEKA